jgi:hypothetical protein
VGVGVGVIKGSDGEGRDLGSGFVCLFVCLIPLAFSRRELSFLFLFASWFDQA